MSYTQPQGQPQGFARHITNKLREALVAEIVAINGYERHIADSYMAEVNEVWHSIMGDEKKHYGMFLTLLRKYDNEQYRAYQEFINSTIVKTPMQTYVPDFNRQIILENIRWDIKGELEASILYEDLAELAQQKDVRDTLLSISAEEKGHVEHLTRLLLIFDADRYNGLR